MAGVWPLAVDIRRCLRKDKRANGIDSRQLSSTRAFARVLPLNSCAVRGAHEPHVNSPMQEVEHPAVGAAPPDSPDATLVSRGRLLVGSVAGALAFLNTLLVYAMAWQGSFGDHYVIVMLGLAWLLLVCYKLSQGRAWARWWIAISLALSTVFGVASIVSPPQSVGPAARWYALVMTPLLATGLYILLFADAASLFFQRARKPS